MIKAIIFDFNRTLYLPELQKIPDENIKLLKKLRDSGFLLALLSIKDNQKENLIAANLSFVSSFFSVIRVVEEKDVAIFREITASLQCQPEEIVVIGDRIRSEIRIANQLGMKTVWYKQGRFSKEEPTEEIEYPTKIIHQLSGIIDILEDIDISENERLDDSGGSVDIQ